MRRSRRRRLLGAVLAGALAPLLAGASSSADPIPVVPIGSGLTMPAGVVETPDGAVWVTDEDMGICRVQSGPPARLVLDEFCGVQHAGPVKASSAAFDPVSGNFYVSDAASAGGAVWRLRWNAGSGRLEGGGAQIVRLPADRVTAVTLVPPESGAAAPDLVYATKESAAVMRVARPGGVAAAPVAIGFAPGKDALGLAHLDGHVYVADGNGVSRLGLGAAAGGPAAAIAGLQSIGATALAADPERHRLYVGTTNGTLDDEVTVLELGGGTVERYERGFAGVTGMIVAAGGDLLVADDPAEAAAVLDPAGQGRLWRIALQPLSRPGVRIDAAPRAAVRETTATFGYSSRAGATFECRFDDAPWAACPGAGSGTIAYDGLPDGVHRFEVRALDEDVAIGSGVPARRTFVVDTRAPVIAVSSEAGDVIRGSRLPVDVIADEPAVQFACSLDDGPYWSCDSSTVLTGLEPGEHVLHAVGTDAAANPSDPAHERSSFRFTILPPLPQEREEEEEDDDDDREDSRPVPPRPAPPAPVRDTGGDVRGATARAAAEAPLRPLRLRPVRFSAPAKGQRARRLRMTLHAPAGARHARVTLLGSGRDSQTRRIAVRNRRLQPGVDNRLFVRLTLRESRRLRPGLYLLTVAVGSSPDRLGTVQTRWVRVRSR